MLLLNFELQFNFGFIIDPVKAEAHYKSTYCPAHHSFCSDLSPGEKE
jgi:hypothetical protein